MNKLWRLAFIFTWIVVILVMIFLAIRLAEAESINQNQVINQYMTKGNGFSAYDIAVKNGFKGNEVQWLASLNGRNSTSTNTVVEKEVEVQTQTTKEVHTVEQVPLKGESSYDLWLRLGNFGTEEDYLSSLKGKDGGILDLNLRFNNDLGLFQTKKSNDTFWKTVPTCGGTSGKVCN